MNTDPDEAGGNASAVAMSALAEKWTPINPDGQMLCLSTVKEIRVQKSEISLTSCHRRALADNKTCLSVLIGRF